MKKVYLLHNVCLNSSYDFNIVKNALDSNNFTIVKNIDDADTLIYAGCGVRGIWVDNAINEINNAVLKNANLNVIATGCFSAIEPNKIKQNVKSKNLNVMSFDNIVQSFTNTNFQDADNALSQTDNIDYEGDNQQRKRISKQQQTILIELENIDKQYNLNIAQTYKNITKGFIFYNEDEPIEYITITRGCPYKCSYCSIPVGRGGEYNSVPLGDIIDKINSAKIKNINKILLLGDEIGNYGLGTNGLDLSELLNHILKDKSLKLAIRYLEPKPFLQHYQTIKKYCENGQIQLLYLPLQSGSNKILKLMNRSYEINNDLIEKILYLKKNTNVIFYTNWMVGFNSETDIDFQSTIDLVKQLDLHINTIIPFSERPNTKATEISNKITIKDKEIRYKKLFNIVQNLKRKRLALGLKSIGNIKREDIINRIIEAEDTSMQFD